MAKESKKELILKVAIVNFSKFGYENTNLDLIAQECKITKPAIYYHYKDKAALYEAVICSQFSKLAVIIGESTVDGDAKGKLRNYIHAFGSFLISHPTFNAIFARELASGASTLPLKCATFLAQTLTILTQILNEGVKEGIFEEENPFMIQMMIVTTLTSCHTTKPLREKVLSLLEDKSELPVVEFDNLIDSLSKKIIKGLLC